MNTFMSVTTCLFCSINKKLIIVFININKHLKLFFKFAEYEDLVELAPGRFQFVPENRRHQVQ